MNNVCELIDHPFEVFINFLSISCFFHPIHNQTDGYKCQIKAAASKLNNFDH